jgi:site-specific DNA-methyltransferase (cytosine-N4-specific)
LSDKDKPADGAREAVEEHGLRSKPHGTKRYTSSIWSFPGSGGEQLYRWYGTLPRALVERLISLYAADDTTRVLDAFTGLGTTLDVAADAQLHAQGVDSNPLACLATEARLFGVPSESAVAATVNRIIKSFIKPASPRTAKRWDSLLAEKRFAYTKKWFREDTLAAMLALLFRIAAVDDPRIQRLLFVSAAQVVRDVASVDPRCTHHLVTKRKPFINPLPLWREKVAQAVKAVRSEPADPALVSVRQASILSAPLADESAEFVFIHPPYLGVIHYHLIHRLATDLLDIVSTVRRPASLRAYDFEHERLKKSDVSTDNTKPYQAFVGQLATVMQRVVAPGGRCAVIIGDQRHKGHLRHPFTDFIGSFESSGFQLEENFIWILQNNGGMHILRRGHFIDHNYILIFHK